MQWEDDLCHLEKSIHLKLSLQLKTMNHTLNYKKRCITSICDHSRSYDLK